MLHAVQFLKQDERFLLENVLLPAGLTNIFFVINWYNLIDDPDKQPEDVAKDKADLDEQVRRHLMPFCVINGVNRSTERIFPVNAQRALKARTSKPPSVELAEGSNVPAFERSLQRFLLEERARARYQLALGLLRTSAEEARRHTETLQAMAGKTIEQIERERDDLEPKLTRLRGIKQMIEGYLLEQSGILQDRLANSFHERTKAVLEGLPEAVKSFDFGDTKKGVITLTALTDLLRKKENRLDKRLEKLLKPQVAELLGREYREWQTKTVRAELDAATVKVESYLQDRAAEYQQVLRDIERQLGIHGGTLQVGDLVDRWLGKHGEGEGSEGLQLSGLLAGSMGDMAVLGGSIVVEDLPRRFDPRGGIRRGRRGHRDRRVGRHGRRRDRDGRGDRRGRRGRRHRRHRGDRDPPGGHRRRRHEDRLQGGENPRPDEFGHRRGPQPQAPRPRSDEDRRNSRARVFQLQRPQAETR